MSPEIDRRIPAALFILRFFLAIFLLQWSVEKLILPDAAARIAHAAFTEWSWRCRHRMPWASPS
jgi:hypothetical protein